MERYLEMENLQDGWNIKLEAAKERNNKMHVRAAWMKHEEENESMKYRMRRPNTNIIGVPWENR